MVTLVVYYMDFAKLPTYVFDLFEFFEKCPQYRYLPYKKICKYMFTKFLK